MTCRHGNSYFARSTKCDVICSMARNLLKTPEIANSSSNRIEFFGHFSQGAGVSSGTDEPRLAGASLVASRQNWLRPKKSVALTKNRHMAYCPIFGHDIYVGPIFRRRVPWTRQ